MKKLPWSEKEYRYLESGDLSPRPAPTPEQRIRVAAAITTRIRDANMTGQQPIGNAETIRAVLVMDEEAWARDIGDVAAVIVPTFDLEDPKTRWAQTVGLKP